MSHHGDGRRYVIVDESQHSGDELRHHGRNVCVTTVTVPVEESDSEEEPPKPEPVAYPPPPVMVKGMLGGDSRSDAAAGMLVPGPTEHFDVDRQGPQEQLEAVKHPLQPIQPATFDNDWLVEGLTPKLRDWVLHRFQEHFVTEPKYVPSIGKFVGARFHQASGSFVTLFIRPHTLVGSDPGASAPVHYNVAKNDLLIFQRDVEVHLGKAQQHIELFDATMNGLNALLAKGMSEGELVSNMLPLSYTALDEVEGVMHEVEAPLFQNIQGKRPAIIVDSTSGAGKHLPFVKAALKRALHTQLASKEAFQLISFVPETGRPQAWRDSLQRPSDVLLNEAEAWIDALAPCAFASLVAAVQLATATFTDIDTIYLLSSGDLDQAHHSEMLSAIRSINAKELPIHVVAVGPSAVSELLLRNIAESNHGGFVMKRFSAKRPQDPKWTSWRTNLVNEKSKQLAENFKKQQMSIGSQMKVVEVMRTETEQKAAAWHEEWKCTQRLLLTSETRPLRSVENRATQETVRTGGGYLYRRSQILDVNLDQYFHHGGALPWTAQSDSVAKGPKVPAGGAIGYGRAPRLPPQSGEPLPEGALAAQEARLQAEERRRVRASSSDSRPRRGSNRVPVVPTVSTNPWYTPGAFDRTQLPVPAYKLQPLPRTGKGVGRIRQQVEDYREWHRYFSNYQAMVGYGGTPAPTAPKTPKTRRPPKPRPKSPGLSERPSTVLPMRGDEGLMELQRSLMEFQAPAKTAPRRPAPAVPLAPAVMVPPAARQRRWSF